MRIEGLSIDAVGPFENEAFDPLSPSVTVVGAPQRAGKTSLRELLGLLVGNQSTDLSSEAQSNVRWRIETESGRFRCSLDGDASLLIEPIGETTANGSRPAVEPLRQRKWCTITPSSLTASENEHLGAQLLGEHYETVETVSEIRDTLAAKATEVGGTHGRAGSSLADPVSRIRAGVDQRTQATERVDRYEATVTERERLRERQRATNDTIEQLSERLELLDIIHQCYADAATLTELAAKTAAVDADQINGFPLAAVPVVRARYDRLAQARERYESATIAFQTAISHVNGTPTVNSITNHSNALRAHCHRLPRLREQYEAIDAQEVALEREESQLRGAAASVNDDWYTDLDAIRSITTDAYARADVQQIVSSYVEANAALSELTHELALAERRRQQLESERSTANPPATYTQSRRGHAITIGGILGALSIGSLGVAILDPMVGVVLTVVGLLAVGTCANRINNRIESAMDSVVQLETSIRTTRSEIETLREQRAERETEREMARDSFESLVADLSLETLAPDAVLENYDRIVACKRRVRAFDEQLDALDRRRSTLRSTLETVSEDLHQAGIRETTPTDPIEAAPELLEALSATSTLIERASVVVDRREEVDSKRAAVNELLDQHESFPTPSDSIAECVNRVERRAKTVQTMRPLLKRADRCRDRITRQLSGATKQELLFDSQQVQELLDETTEVADNSPVERIQQLVAAFDSEATLAARQSQLADRLNHCIETNETRANRARTLERKCSALSDAGHIEAAAVPIRAGRSQLRAQGDRYATTRLAALFLDELAESYVQRTAGPLLERSSDLFSSLTGGEFAGITVDESEAIPRFLAINESGSSFEPTTLSNCTAALLYLAIRMALSEAHDAPLIFDGAFAQFDPVHRRRAITVCANQFSDTQLFILSSQPMVITRCSETFNECTFYALEDGSFSGPTSPQSVVETLSYH